MDTSGKFCEPECLCRPITLTKRTLQEVKIFLGELDSIYDLMQIDPLRAEALRFTYIKVKNTLDEARAKGTP